MNFDIGRILSALGPGLMAAGGQGWSAFGPGMMQGMQYYDQQKQNQLNNQQIQQLRELQQQQLQMSIEEQRDANKRRAKQEQDFYNLFGPGMMSPNQPPTGPSVGGMTQPGMLPGSGGATLQPGLMSNQFNPLQLQFIRAAGPEAMPIVAEQLFKSAPKETWQIAKVREGNNDVTYRINPQTGEREKIAEGAAFAPMQGGQNEFGLAPFYATDANGNLTAYQLSKSGGLTPIQLPGGQFPAQNVTAVNLGTSIQPMGTKTGQVVGAAMPVDVAGKAEQTVTGESIGEAAVSLPDALAAADTALALIDSIKTDPARELGTGMTSIIGLVPGTNVYDFSQKVNQLKGQAFLDAFSSLKGGGAISEIEGQKATQAIGRLDTAQTEEGFMQALSELEAIIKAGKERSRKKAGQSNSVQMSQPVDDLNAIYGLPQ